MEAVDTYIELPPRDVDKPFLMPVEDVFTITGRGTLLQEESRQVYVTLEIQLKFLEWEMRS